MRLVIRRLPIALSLLAVLTTCGCQRKPIPATADSNSPSPTDPAPTVKDKRFATAVKARDALQAELSGRLMEVMQEQGPVAAISVCSEEATTIAESVAKDFGVEIGRTSFKLRNPANAPRAWVEPLVTERVDTPQQKQLENGHLGALFPIHLNVKCLMCHGSPKDLLDEVRVALAAQFPDDQATGFEQGDLRGWFWVEVPASDSTDG